MRHDDATEGALDITVDDRGVATVKLNRPEVRNAFNDAMIGELMATFTTLGKDLSVRAIVLRGEGKLFSAGGDLAWMKRAATFSEDENRADAQRLADMLDCVNKTPKPVIALIHGAAMGGGVGLAAVSDIVIAERTAKFSLSEVRLGLTPATIAPYVVAAIGARNARRYAQTGEVFDGRTAQKIGLVHELVDEKKELNQTLEEILKALLFAAPGAVADAKALISDVAGKDITDELKAETARRIAERRASDEGREGVSAFLEKRKPDWTTS